MCDLLPLAKKVATAKGWDGRTRALMLLGASLPALDAAWQCEAYAVKGCDTQVWLVPPSVSPDQRWQGDAAGRVFKGLLAILLEFANDDSQTKTVHAYSQYLKATGLADYISASKRQGMQKLIAKLALA